jgi:hypothetical protein
MQFESEPSFFCRPHRFEAMSPPRPGVSCADARLKFLPMKKRGGSTRTKKNEPLLTGALYPFYDARQLQSSEPRQGSFSMHLIKGTYQLRPSDGAIKIERAWADVTTAEVQGWIDMFEEETLRHALAGEDEAIFTFVQKLNGAVSRVEENLTRRQREKIESVAAISVFWPVNVTQGRRFARSKLRARFL